MEIVEQNYRKLHPKSSFKQAIEIAMEEGILTDYLDRKSREVINMLCAKYDYKMDIAVKQQEAKEEKAEETAINFIKMNLLTNEQIAQGTGLSVKRIEELTDEIRNY